MTRFSQKILASLLILIFLLSPLAGITQQAQALSQAPLPTQINNTAGFSACLDVTEIPWIECETLLALENSTEHKLSTTYNWKTTNTPCDWVGVICAAGTVTELDLFALGLSGTIPGELAMLSNLTRLELYSNQLSGSIPSQLGKLSKLTYLELNNNRFSGGIPAQLGSLSKLTHLNLSSNQLSGAIPAQLGSLTNLEELTLSSNQLSAALPVKLGSLAKLQFINLSGNRLTGTIPFAFGSLTALRVMDFSNNLLTGGFSPFMGNLINVTTLNLSSNQFSGSLPTDLGRMVSLNFLFLQNNQFSGSIPTQIGSLTQLLDISIHDNQLTGSLPVQIGSLTQLHSLNLKNNHLSGSLPPQLGSLSNLRTLWLSGNQLSGSLPPELGSLTLLNFLYLSNNQLTGALPVELGNLTLLNELTLDNNQFAGEIPASITNLINLTTITLSCGLTTANPDVILFLDGILGSGWTCLRIKSITRLDANPNHSPTVRFAISFTDAVKDLDTADFSPRYTGLSTPPTVSAVSGSGSTRTITLTTGFGSGTLGVNVPLGATINSLNDIPLSGLPNEISDAYTIVLSNTIVSSITRTDASPSNAPLRRYLVQFSTNVTGVDITDFTITRTGLTGTPQVKSITGSGSTREVTVSTATGSGSVRLDIPANASIADNNGYPLISLPYTGGETYIVDRILPWVDSITGTDANPSVADTVQYLVTFTKPVTGVDAADFIFSKNGLVGGPTVTNISGSGTTRTVTVSTAAGTGSFTLNLFDNDSIKDLSGNALGGPGSSNGSYTNGTKYTFTRPVTYYSTKAQDGWLLESAETTSKGKTASSTGLLQAGDDGSNKQYRSLLSFNTSTLPFNAIISSATLRIKKSTQNGADPFLTLGSLIIDLRKGFFGTSLALLPADFEAASTLSAAAAFAPAADDWYTLSLTPADLQYINKYGLTQARLRFTIDDNNNLTADNLTFFAGDAPILNQPTLTLEYTLP